ncbi:hypothetical protein RchiOBHm_MTg0498271 (mitochondrion) [Rosa chinensis]|uniref:Uncharacterized protein n=1 Tax=Rosa chinensis TaxID=74649 RepID=A0A2P6P0Y7_ROSCH|nr:hypothetical protein RchiOBHm_MTg0498271 [Rosa chinensis]
MILEKWQRNVLKGMESVSIGAQPPFLLCDLITSIQAQTNFFLSGGAVIYLDQFPEALEIQTGSENHRSFGPFVSPTKKSSLMISHSFPAEPPLFAIRSTTSAFPFYNTPRRPHCSSKCATPYEDLLPFCPLSVHAVLKAEEEGWAAVPVLFRCTRFISPTHKEGRGGKEAALASVRPIIPLASCIHAFRLTATRGCSCRYVSLSGSLAPPVISFYDMLLSSPYSICHLVISASLRGSTSERNGGLHSVTPRSPSERSE